MSYVDKFIKMAESQIGYKESGNVFRHPEPSVPKRQEDRVIGFL